jgi:hypothetical protein
MRQTTLFDDDDEHVVRVDKPCPWFDVTLSRQRRGKVDTPPLCKCGCGNPVTLRRRSRTVWNSYIRDHHLVTAQLMRQALPPKRGAENPSWKGGVVYNGGYRMVQCPSHPRSHNGYVREHVLVMEVVYRRYLRKGELVHHKDHNKLNNHPDNLEVVSQAEHSLRHRQPGHERICEICGKEFRRAALVGRKGQQKTCSIKCRGLYYKRVYGKGA